MLDDDAYLDRPLDLKAPGTIRVKMHRILVTGTKKWTPRQAPETATVVHEKSKKAGGHITQFVLPVSFLHLFGLNLRHHVGLGNRRLRDTVRGPALPSPIPLRILLRGCRLSFVIVLPVRRG